MNQYKYTDVSLVAMHMENLTGEDIVEANREYRARTQALPKPEQAENSEDSSNSYRSRGSVFDMIGDKGKGPQKKRTHKAQSKNKDDEAEKLRETC